MTVPNTRIYISFQCHQYNVVNMLSQNRNTVLTEIIIIHIGRELHEVDAQAVHKVCPCVHLGNNK